MSTRAVMKRWLRRLIGNWWEVRVCYFPFPEGYATYNPWRGAILDTGLTKEHAQNICDELNGVKGKNEKGR